MTLTNGGLEKKSQCLEKLRKGKEGEDNSRIFWKSWRSPSRWTDLVLYSSALILSHKEEAPVLKEQSDQLDPALLASDGRTSRSHRGPLPAVAIY